MRFAPQISRTVPFPALKISGSFPIQTSYKTRLPCFFFIISVVKPCASYCSAIRFASSRFVVLPTQRIIVIGPETGFSMHKFRVEGLKTVSCDNFLQYIYRGHGLKRRTFSPPRRKRRTLSLLRQCCFGSRFRVSSNFSFWKLATGNRTRS